MKQEAMAQTGARRSSAEQQPAAAEGRWQLLAYLLVGTLFGVVLIQSQVVSWFRIQEMFRFQSFFMYGVLGSGVATSALVLWAGKRLGWRALDGQQIRPVKKPWGPGVRHRYWLGGILFGLGWGLAGTCPGPIYALIGYGSGAAVVVLLSALAGARAYAAVADRLPH